MASRITVVVSQGQSHNPAKRKLEEDIVAGLLGKSGIDVTVLPHLYDLAPDGTGMLCLHGITGDVIVLSWLYSRAAHWTLARNGIHGQFGSTLLFEPADEEEDEDDSSAETEEAGKQRVIDSRSLPDRTIYCIDLRIRSDPAAYITEVERIAAETATQTVGLTDWIGGEPKQAQLDRALQPAPGNVHHGEGNGRPAAAPNTVEEEADRRWYPVIDFSRCTNCMECIDFCLFGVYGVDRADTILVEQPDNCRKGCPACSRVCPENAIIFPQHKTPAIAGSPEVAGALKIDLSKLFGAPNIDPEDIAVRERDEQLLLAGRTTVGHSVGLPKRQPAEPPEERDDLDNLIDQLEELDL